MKNLTKILIGLIFLIIFTITSCEKDDLGIDVPKCIESKIKEIKKESVQNPPAQVWEWKVNGKTYYYITSGCCDQYNFLYDEKCNIVCAPDGGISGGGDGKCPESMKQANQILIWEDDRK